MITDDQKKTLLGIARASLVAHLSGQTPVGLPVGDLPEATGVFVTLKKRGTLRGCLGVLELRASLAEEVARCARDAASVDPRFPPIAGGELADTALEISVLGVLEPIDPLSPADIEIGRHGLVVEQGHRRGLLLPQVAVEWGWTREQFLTQTCRKAGLAPDAWRNGARVFRFDAQVFAE
jgi:AmmeMemoRadiSam system protein A